MTGAVEERLRAFACRLLERSGAEVEWPSGEEGLALLPSPVAQTLHCLEILPLAADGESPLPISLASDFLDRIEPLVWAEPSMVSLRIERAYLKRADMAAPVERAFTWLNARVRVQQAEPVRTEYQTWYFLATVDSADRWQQVIRVSLNTATGAEIQLPDVLDTGWLDIDLTPAEPAVLPAEYASTQLAAVRAALARAEAQSRPFVSRLEGRLERDRKRIQGYYRSLVLGDGRRSRKPGREQDPAEREAKLRVVKLELHRKLAELDERYACRVDLTPLVLARLDCPALAVRCRVQRRSATRHITIFWNPLTKDLEPLCCARCGVSTFSLAFSDERVHAHCASCLR